MIEKGKKADYAFLSIDKFSKSDEFQYKMVCEVWESMFAELIDNAGAALHRYICEYGLIKTIGDCAEIADRILAGFDGRPVVTTEISRSGLRNLVMDAPISIEEKLLLLRFPKRFTWHSMKAIEKKAIAQFKQNNNRIKMLDRRGLNKNIVSDIRYIVDSFLPRRIKTYTPDLFRDVPEGATADTPNCKALKILGILRHRPEFLRWPLIEVAPKLDQCSKLSFVPKNYKVPRGICAEPVLTNFLATSYREVLLQVLASKRGKYHPGGRVLTKDQTRNQRFAIKANSHGFSTIDLTAASDSISASFVYALWPEFASRVAELRSKEVEYDGQRFPLYVFCTMGFRVTFELESLGFWVCICVAHLWAETLGHELYDLDDCTVYGDDIIIPTGLVDWLLPILQACGFKVNTTKSYTSENGRFFESCGVDVLDGNPLSTCYWPRKAISRDTIPSIVSLQNRLFETGKFPVTANKLGDTVQALYKIPDSTLEYIENELHHTPENFGNDVTKDFKTKVTPLGVARSLPVIHEIPVASYSYQKRETVTIIDKTKPITNYDWCRVPDSYLYENGRCYCEYFNKALGRRIFLPKSAPLIIHSKFESHTTQKRTSIPKYGDDGVQLAYRDLSGRDSFNRPINRYGYCVVTEVAKAYPVLTGELAVPQSWNLSTQEYRKAVSTLRMAEFLNSGPKYQSKLDELLGISSHNSPDNYIRGVRRDRYEIKRSKIWILDERYE